jgi:integrase
MHLAFRGSDLLSLNLSHVAGKRAGDEVTVAREGKTRKRRTTNLNEQCVAALRPLLRGRRAQGAGPDDPLFVSSRNRTRLTIVSLSRMWKGWCERAGLVGTFASHTGRKTKAYILRVEDGMPIEVLMDVLNHSSPAATLRYACIQPEERRQFYMREL